MKSRVISSTVPSNMYNRSIAQFDLKPMWHGTMTLHFQSLSNESLIKQWIAVYLQKAA